MPFRKTLERHGRRWIKLVRSDGVGGVLIRGAGGRLGAKICGVGLAFGVHVLLARLMGAEQYGVYMFALTILHLLLIPCLFGFDTAIVRFSAAYAAQQEWNPLRGLYRRSTQFVLALSLTAGLGVALAVFAFGGPGRSDLTATLLVGAFLLPVLALSAIRRASLRALKRVVVSEAADGVVRPILLALGVAVAVLWAGRQLDAAVAMQLNIFGAVGGLLVASVYLQRKRPKEVYRARPEFRTREWVRTALPLLFVSGLYMLLGRVDKLMLGMLRDPAEVGFYSVASRVASLALFGMQASNSIAAPLISEFHSAKSREELQGLVSRVAKLIAGISAPVLLGLLILGPWILALFGEEFKTAYLALVLLTLGQAVNASTGPVGFLLTMTGHERKGLQIVTISLVVNILLNVPGIYFFGISGAAGATSVSIVVRNLLTWHASKKLLSVDSSVWGLIAARRRRKRMEG